MQSKSEFEKQELITKGLYTLGYNIVNIAKWEEEIIQQDLPLPTLEQIVDAAEGFYAPPSTITMRQCRLNLNNIGKLSIVSKFIENASTPVQIEWEYATEIPRHNALVEEIGELLSMSQKDLDLFFIEASKL